MVKRRKTKAMSTKLRKDREKISLSCKKEENYKNNTGNDLKVAKKEKQKREAKKRSKKEKKMVKRRKTKAIARKFYKNREKISLFCKKEENYENDIRDDTD